MLLFIRTPVVSVFCLQLSHGVWYVVKTKVRLCTIRVLFNASVLESNFLLFVYNQTQMLIKYHLVESLKKVVHWAWMLIFKTLAEPEPPYLLHTSPTLASPLQYNRYSHPPLSKSWVLRQGRRNLFRETPHMNELQFVHSEWACWRSNVYTRSSQPTCCHYPLEGIAGPLLFIELIIYNISNFADDKKIGRLINSRGSYSCKGRY